MKRINLLLPVILLFAGCSHTNVRMYNAAGLTGAADAVSVPVLYDGQPTNGTHKVIGQVFAERAMNGDSEQGIATLLGLSAARMGADAVIGTRYNQGANGWRWASGLAIEYLEGDADMAPPPDYTVAMLAVADLRESSIEGAPDRVIFAKLAEYHMQRLGYFTRIAPDSLTLEQIRAMKPESLRAIGGEDTALLLLLTIGGNKGFNVGVLASQSVMLSAVLISKETGTTVWDGSAEGSHNALGLLSVLTEGGGTRRGRAIASGVSSIFQTLPPRSTGSPLKWGSDLEPRFFPI